MHWLLVYFYVFDVSFVLALLLTPFFKRLSFQWNYVDQPDQERKIHSQAMPLLGGGGGLRRVRCSIVMFNYLFAPSAGAAGWICRASSRCPMLQNVC